MILDVAPISVFLPFIIILGIVIFFIIGIIVAVVITKCNKK